MSLDPRLRLRHLRCFAEIARSGSLGAAADVLSVSQPAASKTLKELETILGQPLFDRSGRRLRLNAAGRVFQQFAGAGLAELERAQDAVRGARGETVKLAIGVLPTAATDLVPVAALRFREVIPHCTLRVFTGPNWLLLSQLRDASLDLVVGRMADAERMAGLSFEQLYLEEIVAVVRAGHPLTTGHALDLAAWPLILPPKGAVISATVRGYLISIGAGAVQPAFETVSLAFGRRTVQRSDCIWFISRGVVAEELALGSLRALPLDAPMLAGPVGISQREDAPPSPEKAALIACLKDVAQKQRQKGGGQGAG